MSTICIEKALFCILQIVRVLAPRADRALISLLINPIGNKDRYHIPYPSMFSYE